jgi:hypothetical protein
MDDGMPTVLALHPNEASTYVRNGNTQTKIHRYGDTGRGESRLGRLYQSGAVSVLLLAGICPSQWKQWVGALLAHLL